MKPGPNFKLSKSAKRLIASQANPRYSNMIKRNFIQAELHAAIQPRASKIPRIEKGAE